jgi:predicted aspartyl protease
MATSTMGKVLVSATVENLMDLFEVRQGRRKAEEARRAEIPDCLVDTGATCLSLPHRFVQQLGLERYRTRRARTSSGEVKDFDMYGMVRLTVQGRECNVEAAAISDDCPALIGQVPLELLDFIVDPVGQRLLGNPAHGGEQMFDMFDLGLA